MPSCKFADWLARPDSRIAVVGASGWIGMALVDQILALAPDLSADRIMLFGSRLRQMTIRNRVLAVSPLTPDSALGDGRWLILHAGIIGADRVDKGDLDEVRRCNDRMLDQVLALSGTGAVDRLVFVSSGAATRPASGGLAKQAYADMKLAHETAVSAWGLAREIPVLIPRVFNLGGPYINHTSAYALGHFILQYAREGRIRIGTGSRVWRDFVHVHDMARGVLDMAVDQAETGVPFDVSLGRTSELGDLAQAVSQAFGRVAIIDRPADAGGSPDDYRGHGERFRNALERCGGAPVGLDQIVADTLAYLRETGEVPPATD